MRAKMRANHPPLVHQSVVASARIPTPDDRKQLHEALTFVLTFARPTDLSLSSDETAWREFDARRKRKGPDPLSDMEWLARRLNLWGQVESELRRLRDGPAPNPELDPGIRVRPPFEAALAELHEDLTRIFGNELGDVTGEVTPTGHAVIRGMGPRVFVRTPPEAIFVCYRRVGDRIDATLYNRAGTRVDQRTIEPPSDLFDWFDD